MIIEEGTRQQFKWCLWRNVEHRRCLRGHVLVQDIEHQRHILDIVDSDCPMCFKLWEVRPMQAMHAITNNHEDEHENGGRVLVLMAQLIPRMARK